MKRIFFLTPCLVGLLLAGCGPDPRIQKQQEQINVLVRQVDDLKARLDGWQKIEAGNISYETNAAAQYHLTNERLEALENSPDLLHLTASVIELQAQMIQVTNYLGARFMRATALPAAFSDPTKYDQATGLPVAK